ncbi:AP-3 complex subunit beta-1 [Phytophthora ramorum]|uniref:AP-3 complex subunit beta-1 n=1 Tax=Phytophthora ramorum TaxID=164328 RepID=UPI0030998F97|nr:AP-3 complex subunit beta-1 [Phytophthora ramorum]
MAMAIGMKSITGDAHFFEESMNLDRIRKLLDNKLGVAGHAEKLEAMKALLASISKGEDVSAFFADVVKNVIVASVEVKKLVYMYLVHYADANSQCRELALLSINSFQKDLADQNQLIRALALRVMTSIRVRDILQIQLIAIRKCAADDSAYVRKCATNAISKVFAVDPEQKDVLAEIIGTLLNDSSTMVLGSAVQALNEVCPDRLDLLHRPFRKLCHLLADIDEWGQTVMLNVLISGSEDAQDKNKLSSQSPFMLGAGSVRGETLPSIGSVFRSDALASGIGGGEELDEDHRLLLRSSIPLLKSRNSAVVLAVATLHYYCGTHSMATSTLIGKSLVRIMRNQREIQYVVLSEFFVRATDPAYARKLKLEILTSVVTNDNVSTILREFQAYVRHVDKSFVTMTVRALGRVADAMPPVAERCLSGLMRLVRSSNEQVVAESVVVIRQLLQQQAIKKDRLLVVRSLAAMMVTGRVTSPSARASIVWMLGEFNDDGNGTTCAAESLRLLAKDFSDESTEVRLQLLNLAVKLGLREPQKRTIQLLLQYVIELCKFDIDYDVRDRARLCPWILSLPEWRSAKPDRSLRDESSFIDNKRSGSSRQSSKTAKKKEGGAKGFYSDESSGSESSDSESESESESESGSGSDYSSESGSSEASDSGSESASSSSGSESDASSAEESESEESSEERVARRDGKKEGNKAVAETIAAEEGEAELPVLFPGGSTSMAQLQVDFVGRLDNIPLEIVTSADKYEVDLSPVVGELFVPQQMSLDDFERRISMTDSASLHTSEFTLPVPVQMNAVVQAVQKDCNVAQVYEINNMNGVVGKCKFAGRFRSGDASAENVLVGLEVQLQTGQGRLLVVMRDSVLAQRLTTGIKRALPL